MAAESETLEMLGREPDERLLGEASGQLPATVGEPPAPLPESATRRHVVRVGAAMTGVTLIGGIALALLGLVEAIADGSLVWFVVLFVGILLASTHWGWVHVAELTGNAIQARHNAPGLAGQRAWLLSIEPYPRWEVSTSAGEDGSIAILTTRHVPVASGERTFMFVREELAREVHSAQEPAAAVTERAESLRRAAALETERARQTYEAARDAYEHALMVRDDDQQRRAALHAASEALSERINANLRDPPLTE